MEIFWDTPNFKCSSLLPQKTCIILKQFTLVMIKEQTMTRPLGDNSSKNSTSVPFLSITYPYFLTFFECFVYASTLLMHWLCFCKSLWSVHYFHPHFTDKANKMQSQKVAQAVCFQRLPHLTTSLLKELDGEKPLVWQKLLRTARRTYPLPFS